MEETRFLNSLLTQTVTWQPTTHCAAAVLLTSESPCHTSGRQVFPNPYTTSEATLGNLPLTVVAKPTCTLSVRLHVAAYHSLYSLPNPLLQVLRIQESLFYSQDFFTLHSFCFLRLPCCQQFNLKACRSSCYISKHSSSLTTYLNHAVLRKRYIHCRFYLREH